MHDQRDLPEALGRLPPDAGPATARSVLLVLGRHAAGEGAPPHVPTAALRPLLDAARAVASDVTASTSALGDLDDRWHRAASQEHADAALSAPLLLHLEALYALEAVEALAEALPEEAASIGGAGQNLAAAFAAHDAALRGHVGLLCTLADGGALAEWRRSLPAGMNPLPWWLDGALEAEAAALARRTDALTGRISSAFGSKPVVTQIPQAMAAAQAIRAAAGFTLAAATATPAGLTSHSWRHPSLPVSAVVWVPTAFDDAADLRMVFRGSAERDEGQALVGEVMLLGGIPAVVRLERDGTVERVEASWPAHAVAAVACNSLTLTDSHGRHWIPGG